ncbi:MAG: hypothetical protein PHD82_01985 [Candidatus Riflebacteria bacterium]|nr:hypothetical protein [Candidatus Riflebacteria bacterium]
MHNLIKEFSSIIHEKITNHPPSYDDDYIAPYKMDPKALDFLLSTAFFASLFFDEERPTKFRLLCIERDGNEERYQTTSFTNTFLLSSKIQMSPENLAKVAQAANFHQTFLVCEFFATPKYHAEIVGFFHLGSSMEKFQKNQTFGAWATPFEYIISSTGPGTVSISFGDENLGVFNKSELIFSETSIYSQKTFFAPFSSELEAIRSQIENNCKIITSENQRKTLFMYFMKIIDSILQGIAQLKHGGCVILLDNSANQDYIRIRYRLEQKGEPLLKKIIRFIQKRLEQSNKDADISSIKKISEGIWQEISDLATFISSLSGTDGAIILQKDLTLIGYGAILHSPDRPDLTISTIDDEVGAHQKLTDLHFGTRHQSSLNFVANEPNSLAFVISQDGRISGFLSFNNEVCAIPNLNKKRYFSQLGL